MTSNVFVNRILNMRKIKYIGLDMDHTLIRYNTEHFERSVYERVIERLLADKHYPPSIRALQFDFQKAIRGLVVDSKHGNILKLSRFGAIRESHHGTKPMDYAAQQAMYRSTYVDLNDHNYMIVDTSFSIAFCVLYAQLIDEKDKAPADFPSYHDMAQDVLGMVDVIHADGSLKGHISQHLEDYVIKDAELVKGLLRFRHSGKKIFILTNSDYHYSKLLLDYAINPFLPDGMLWTDVFEYVITLAVKPRFFYDNQKFLRVDPKDGAMHNWYGPIEPGIYQGGGAKAFTQALHARGDEILYVGDHIYGDIVRLKKDCNWRTALVVEELGAEIAGQVQAQPIDRKIEALMREKIDIENRHTQLATEILFETKPQQDDVLKKMQEDIQQIDAQLSSHIQEQQKQFNLQWGRIFRAGAEESYFAYQVERYACIYMEKLSDLFQESPIRYFRAHRRILPHDIEK